MNDYLLSWKLERGYWTKDGPMSDADCDLFEAARREWGDRFIYEPENLTGPGRLETNYGSWSKYTCPYKKTKLAEWMGYDPPKKVVDARSGHIDKDELKAKLDIFEVIGNYTQLRVRGDRATSLCPLHNEKTPSFSVNRKKGVWYCFAEGEGGDVIKFIMKAENCDFKSALTFLDSKP